MTAGAPRESTQSHVRRYFVDEAGDLSLFDRKGRVIVGNEGVSNYFMVGLAQIDNPAEVARRLDILRTELQADPYFKGVPSMQPEARRTALAFHAKNDLPEVRREVFRLLPQFGCKVQVAIRQKSVLASEAQSLHRYHRKKLRADDIYDDLVSRIFRNVLHKADENHIVFARRGSSDRIAALDAAIIHAKQRFADRWGGQHDKPTLIRAAYPHEVACLQVVDYYLWALQRLYERREDRYFAVIADGFRLIMDIDNKKNRRYGEWFTDRNPLAMDKINNPERLGSDRVAS
jgi:hypothetical protein